MPDFNGEHEIVGSILHKGRNCGVWTTETLNLWDVETTVRKHMARIMIELEKKFLEDSYLSNSYYETKNKIKKF